MSAVKPKCDFEPLNKNNYQAWINHVRDYLLGADAMNFYDASELRGNETKNDGDAFDYAEPKVDTAKGKAAWTYVRRHLTPEIYDKTNKVPFANVVALLRKLRLDWHGQSPFDRAAPSNTRESTPEATPESTQSQL